MKKFPEGFLWGTATAAHQVEGNNKNTDWWEYEQTKDETNRTFPLEPSNQACDSYNRYEEDFDLCKDLNNNAVRLSISWARIEPNEGEFAQNEIEHYRKVLQAARDRNLKTYVTLFHFVSPLWVSKKGGWHTSSTTKYFERYAKKIAEELDDLIDSYQTINEPQVYTMLGYVGYSDWNHNDIARWPPAKSNYLQALFTQLNFIKGHKKAFKAIKEVNPKAKVGIVKNITWWDTDPFNTSILDTLAASILNVIGRDFFLFPLRKHLDFIGLNYYFTNRIKRLKWDNPNDYVTDLGWWINPNGLEKILVYLKRYNLPIYITENGLADAEDKFRKQYIRDHLISCLRAIDKGVDLRGYFYWSLIDNYEWHHGFWPRFGIVEIDRENGLQRKPRPSFDYYSSICKNNALDLDVV